MSVLLLSCPLRQGRSTSNVGARMRHIVLPLNNRARSQVVMVCRGDLQLNVGSLNYTERWWNWPHIHDMPKVLSLLKVMVSVCNQMCVRGSNWEPWMTVQCHAPKTTSNWALNYCNATCHFQFIFTECSKASRFSHDSNIRGTLHSCSTDSHQVHMHILIILIWKCLFLLQVVPCDTEHLIVSTGQ